MEEHQRNQILVAVHDEACRLLRRLGVNYAAELEALVPFVIGLLRMQLLVCDDAHGKSANAGVTAYQRLAVFRLVLVEPAASTMRARISLMS